jgi:LPPG:FO 2-phospho-L-lactate transferase
MRGEVVLLSGGVGGAKLALGMARVLPPGALTVVANTGDDFEHLGLSISPDLDTLLYTLGGVADPETGWGRRDETWSFMAALEEVGGATWFRLGDRDLATHVERTRRLGAGESLASITADFARRFGIAARLLPMSDDAVRTRLGTEQGWLDFQDYFVRLRCAPAVREIAYEGSASARPNADFLGALGDREVRAIVIAPSNPFLSIEPILSLPGVRAALAAAPAPVIAVSPIIAGEAVKGPTGKLMRELGVAPSAASVAARYRDFLDLYVLDRADAGAAPGLAVRAIVANTLMRTLADRETLARAVLEAADAARGRR